MQISTLYWIEEGWLPKGTPHAFWPQQGFLSTYLIPGIVGRRVRFGSESLYGGGAGGVWKSGSLEIWKSGNLEILEPGNLEPSNLEIWNPENLKHNNSQIQNQCLPKCCRKHPTGSVSDHFKPFLLWAGKIQKEMQTKVIVLLFNPVTGLGPLLLSTLGGAILCIFPRI